MTLIEKQKKFFDEVIKPRLVDMAVDDKIPTDMNNIDWYDFVGEAAKHNTEAEEEPKVSCGRYVGKGCMCGDGIICEKCEAIVEEIKQLRRDVTDLRRKEQLANNAYRITAKQKLDLKTENTMIKRLMAGALLGAYKEVTSLPNYLVSIRDILNSPTEEELEEIILTGKINDKY